jgi:hypothetical protein
VASNNPEKASEALKSYFSQEQMRESLANAAKNAVLEYLSAIDSFLSSVQRESLHKIIEKYSSSQSAS